MSLSIRWLPALMLLLFLPALVAAASGTGSRTMDYAWLLFLKANPKIDVVVAIGDSITVGVGDELSCEPNPPNTPPEELSKSCDGYTVPLAGRLSGANGYASTVYLRERGTSGVQSSYGVSHIQQILADHPAADQYLVLYGTNDASADVYEVTFRNNMEIIIKAILAKGMEPILAYIPYAKPPRDYLNPNIIDYNSEIYDLSIKYNLKQGPSFYAWYRDHPDQLNDFNPVSGAVDGIHPTHYGYSEMARKWANEVLIQ